MPPTCAETTSATSTWACTEIGPSSRPCRGPGARGVLAQDLRAEALPPLRPAAFFWAVVPPCFELERELDEPDFLPPRLEEPGEFAIFAARSFDIPFLRSPSYCFSFLTLARLLGMGSPFETRQRRFSKEVCPGLRSLRPVDGEALLVVRDQRDPFHDGRAADVVLFGAVLDPSSAAGRAERT